MTNDTLSTTETVAMTFEIVDYQPLWPQKFQTHARVIADSLGDTALRIEHIGSTSVPGLAAKPIIDILLVVEDSADEDSYLSKMETVGYELRVREPDFYEHRMFSTPARDVHVHLLLWFTGNRALSDIS